MGKGKTKSKLSLSKRRERAFQLFARGYTNRAVAEDLGVSVKTVADYRKIYSERLQVQVAANPDFLSKTVERTMQALDELDHIRADAWDALEDRTLKVEHQCPECGQTYTIKEKVRVPDQTRAQMHNVLLKAQDQRAKLFGVLGVDQQMLAEVMKTQYVQTRIIEWMAEHLEPHLRNQLADFLVGELGEYMKPDGRMGAFADMEPREIEAVGTVAL